MESKAWLKDKLANLATEIDGVEFKYGYDKLSETHFVSVAPSGLLTSDERFNSLRFDLLHDFYNLYASESVVFLPVEEAEEFSDYEEVICRSQTIDSYLDWLNASSIVESEVKLSSGSQESAAREGNYAIAA